MFNHLMQEMRMCDTSSYQNFVYMNAATFEELLTAIAPRITFQDTSALQRGWPSLYDSSPLVLNYVIDAFVNCNYYIIINVLYYFR